MQNKRQVEYRKAWLLSSQKHVSNNSEVEHCQSCVFGVLWRSIGFKFVACSDERKVLDGYDCHIGLVMTGRPVKISELPTELETFQNCFVTQSIQKKIASRSTGHHWWVSKRTKQLSGVDLKKSINLKREFSRFKACETDSKQLQALLISFLSQCIFLNCSWSHGMLFEPIYCACECTEVRWVSWDIQCHRRES